MKFSKGFETEVELLFAVNSLLLSFWFKIKKIAIRLLTSKSIFKELVI